MLCSCLLEGTGVLTAPAVPTQVPPLQPRFQTTLEQEGEHRAPGQEARARPG